MCVYICASVQVCQCVCVRVRVGFKCVGELFFQTTLEKLIRLSTIVQKPISNTTYRAQIIQAATTVLPSLTGTPTETRAGR